MCIGRVLNGKKVLFVKLETGGHQHPETMKMSKTSYIVSGVRTPIGKFRGALSAIRTDDLAAHVLRELLVKNPSLDPAIIEDVIMGCANQAGEDNRNVARMALLLAG